MGNLKFLDLLIASQSRPLQLLCCRPGKACHGADSRPCSLPVLDFGLSINSIEERPVTRLGTLDYMAPEVLVCPDKKHPDENKGNVSLAYGGEVDAWGVGVLTYELLIGRPPFAMVGRPASSNARGGNDRLLWDICRHSVLFDKAVLNTSGRTRQHDGCDHDQGPALSQLDVRGRQRLCAPSFGKGACAQPHQTAYLPAYLVAVITLLRFVL